MNLAEAAGFTPDDSWEIVPYQFHNGKEETLFIGQTPRLVILNRSGPLMSKDGEVIKYDVSKKGLGWKSFSYAIVFFLDENNQLLSQIPFRLKCTGQAGFSFIKHYSYYENSNNFTQQFLKIYQQLTGDRHPKNQLFFSHAVYVPKMVKGMAVSRNNGQSSPACLTEGFLEPTLENFTSLIIRNGSEVSSQIKDAIESTKNWIKLGSLENEETEVMTSDNLSYGVEHSTNLQQQFPIGGNGLSRVINSNGSQSETEKMEEVENLDAIPF